MDGQEADAASPSPFCTRICPLNQPVSVFSNQLTLDGSISMLSNFEIRITISLIPILVVHNSLISLTLVLGVFLSLWWRLRNIFRHTPMSPNVPNPMSPILKSLGSPNPMLDRMDLMQTTCQSTASWSHLISSWLQSNNSFNPTWICGWVGQHLQEGLVSNKYVFDEAFLVSWIVSTVYPNLHGVVLTLCNQW